VVVVKVVVLNTDLPLVARNAVLLAKRVLNARKAGVPLALVVVADTIKSNNAIF
jgi:hypothetical protein